MLSTDDTNGLTNYVYDAKGSRLVKDGKFGAVLYVNNNYTVRNDDLESKHVFAGNTRVASKLVMKEGESLSEKGIYFYHGDHLGSSSVITDKAGAYHESLEYFPYGETWVQERVSEDADRMPFKFTGKEQDPETGLYYFGARYYDVKLSRWSSADPILIKYLDGKPSGGVYSTINMDLYHYAGNNPIKFIDPNGMWKDKSKKIMYNRDGVTHKAELNMGEVTKGDSLWSLSKRQLKNEGRNINGKNIKTKIDQIKNINSLKSDTIRKGQQLVLGVGNDIAVSEASVQDASGDMLLLVGGTYGLYKAGTVGLTYAAGRILSTEIGIKTTLALGSITSAAQLGINNRTINAISKLPQLGNGVLMYGPQVSSAGRGFVQGLTPGPPTLNNGFEAIGWGFGESMTSD